MPEIVVLLFGVVVCVVMVVLFVLVCVIVAVILLCARSNWSDEFWALCMKRKKILVSFQVKEDRHRRQNHFPDSFCHLQSLLLDFLPFRGEQVAQTNDKIICVVKMEWAVVKLYVIRGSVLTKNQKKARKGCEVVKVNLWKW